MRMKKEISDLEARAKTITFPKADDNFGHFQGWLRKVIDENCGYPISKTLEYCDYGQKFYVTIEASGQLLLGRDRDETDIVDRACVTVHLSVEIDPREPILPQIEHIIEMKEAVQRRHNLLGGFMYCHKQGYKMAKPDES